MLESRVFSLTVRGNSSRSTLRSRQLWRLHPGWAYNLDNPALTEQKWLYSSIPTTGIVLGFFYNPGVLLLNAVLTVRAHQANSHRERGWEQFTDAVVSWLNENLDGLVFMLWGAYAQKKGSSIDRVGWLFDNNTCLLFKRRSKWATTLGHNAVYLQ